MRHATILAAALALGGCASDAIRPTAVETMRLSQDLKTELTAFAARQNVEMQARREQIAALEENTSLSAFSAQKHLIDWRAADNQAALRAFEQATSLPTGTQLAGKATSELFAPAAPDRRVPFDAKAYDALLNALKALSNRRGAEEEARFLLQYGQTIVDRMKADVASAAAEDQGAHEPAQAETGNE